MTATQWVQGEGAGFWAYDVSLALFLDALTRVVETREPLDPWLREAIDTWKQVKAISDYGLNLPAWSPGQKDIIADMLERACREIAEREFIPASEVEARGVFPRGAATITTAPIVELGRAIVQLVRGTLPVPPPETQWFYGTSGGRTTLPTRTP